MVELLLDGAGQRLDVAVVDQVALLGVQRPGHHDVHPEAVAVHAAALVALREAGEPVGGLEREALDQADVHRARV